MMKREEERRRWREDDEEGEVLSIYTQDLSPIPDIPGCIYQHVTVGIDSGIQMKITEGGGCETRAQLEVMVS